jgi:hypothetical protein
LAHAFSETPDPFLNPNAENENSQEAQDDRCRHQYYRNPEAPDSDTGGRPIAVDQKLIGSRTPMAYLVRPEFSINRA